MKTEESVARLLPILLIAVLLLIPLSVFSQKLQVNKQQKFPHHIPAGNYSGITAIGNERYAVVCDKSDDGFFVFHIDIDTLSGRILGVQNEGFHPSGCPNRDQEGISFQPFTRTLFISGEADNQIMEYTLDGRRTGQQLQVPQTFSRLDRNYGLESLCYDDQTHRFYTISERPAKGDSVLWLTSFSDDGTMLQQYAYMLDTPKPKRKGVFLNGVSELCALGGGRLLVLERTLRIPPLKIGSYAECRLYVVQPSADRQLQKTHLHTFRTKINLFRRNFANYEGLCVAKRLTDGSIILLMIADSQNHYKGILRDWLKTIRLSTTYPPT